MAEMNIGLLTLQNNPLYLEAFYVTSQEETLRFHYIVHCALDAVEEKGACTSGVTTHSVNDVC